MTYDPSKYPQYFPNGYFEFNQKPITSWDDSHKLFALNQIPRPQKSIHIDDGLVIELGCIMFQNGFSNYLITEIDLKKRKIDINFIFGKPRYPLDIFDSLSDVKYLTNLGYFYLTDNEKYDPVKPPKVRVGNLVISRSKVVNLPILNRSALLFQRDGSIIMRYLRARGEMDIDGVTYLWSGSLTRNPKGSIIIYNSSNIQMDYVNHPIMGPSRTAKKTYVIAQKRRLFAICKRLSGRFKVVACGLKKTMINDKDLVLEYLPEVKIVVGSAVKPISVDSLDLGDVQSGVSVGPMLFSDKERTARQVRNEQFGIDMANPNNPHLPKSKMARGCLVKINDYKLVSVLIDGIPQAGDIYPGVTLDELVDFVYTKYPNAESVVCTDPSSTMKGIYRLEGKTIVFGNTHYLAHKRQKDGSIKFWPNGILGRKINSMIVVR